MLICDRFHKSHIRILIQKVVKLKFYELESLQRLLEGLWISFQSCSKAECFVEAF